MLKKLRQQQKGFTIIEILIVLAIAALILLIIFFAVPSLQRNSRNTQIRNDANVILGFTNDYVANHNGALPIGAFYNTTTGDICMDSAAVTTCAGSTATGYVGHVRAGLTAAFTISATGPAEPTVSNTLAVWYGGKCAGNTITGGVASGRAASVGFVTEIATGVSNQCVEG